MLAHLSDKAFAGALQAETGARVACDCGWINVGDRAFLGDRRREAAAYALERMVHRAAEGLGLEVDVAVTRVAEIPGRRDLWPIVRDLPEVRAGAIYAIPAAVAAAVPSASQAEIDEVVSHVEERGR